MNFLNLDPGLVHYSRPVYVDFADIILAAGFSNLYYDKTFASLDMTASSSITTIEKLFKGEQVRMGRYFT